MAEHEPDQGLDRLCAQLGQPGAVGSDEVVADTAERLGSAPVGKARR